ncbi:MULTISPECIES: ABC transporter permease [Thermococcus]|uniref:Osmoprotection protein (ProW-2) n=2 Tax=Thermococcus sibiricus TaxID=172049 RepID=C5ZZV6_THESM|nr:MULTISPECIES: ABC transporter permease [Thermococcus]KUK29155.1 MAG: Osmoprotection protein (ProW-2) [Thermococcus sp. 40_45]HII66974.1 ABC transporter permease [Thermococcaceae archaeon]ACS90937.1 Osmoprotection protein (proW-2) [Thermococcus sibiricus MM 739]KUK18514.1 MAG: Osmoprotection protein (ProW-2) [Thermococcus sibiricus]MBC7094046.1 ABC transporter permease [Thermococcus sp.]
MDIRWVWESQNLTKRTVEHLWMFGVALGLALIIGVFLGFVLYKRPKIAALTFNILNVIETVPTLALLVLFLPILGLGEKPTIAASVLYSILPIARNTYTGLTSVERSYLEVAEAIGLSEREILFKVRFPLALPLIAAGVRIAVVFTMGVVTLGGLVAAGGLGAPIQTGIHLYDRDIIVVTGLWVGILALILDGVAALIENYLRERYGRR